MMGLFQLPAWATQPRVWIVAGILAVLCLLLLHRRLGRAVVWGLERVIEHCDRLREAALHLGQPKPESSSLVTTNSAGNALADPALRSQAVAAEESPPALGASAILVILVRLFFLAVAIELLLGLFVLDFSRTGFVLFSGQAGSGVVTLPVSVSAVLGLLSWALTAFWGAFLADLMGWSSKLLEMFPYLGAQSRRSLRWVAVIGALLLLVYIVLLNLVAQLIILHLQWPQATVVLAVLQGVLVNGAGIFSVALLAIGLAAVFALGCVLVSLLCNIVRIVLRPLVGSQDMTQPVSPEEGLRMTTAIERSLYFLGIGPNSSQFLQEILLPSVMRMGGADALGGYGACDPEHLHQAPPSPKDRTHVGPVQADVFKARKLSSDPDHQAELVNLHLVHQIEERVSVAHQPTGQVVFIVDAQHAILATQAIAQAHAHLPHHAISCLVRLPGPGEADEPRVGTGLWQLEDLVRQRAMSALIPLDPRSALALQRGDKGSASQDELVATTVASLLVGPLQDKEQPTLGALLEPLGRRAPWVGLSTDSVQAPVGQEKVLWRVLRRLLPGLHPRGVGDLAVMRDQDVYLAQQLVNPDNTSVRCLDVAPDVRQPPVVLTFIEPFSARDEARWKPYEEETRYALIQQVPTARVALVRGAGTPDRRVRGAYYHQGALLYPIATLPPIWDQMRRQAMPEFPAPAAADAATTTGLTLAADTRDARGSSASTANAGSVSNVPTAQSGPRRRVQRVGRLRAVQPLSSSAPLPSAPPAPRPRGSTPRRRDTHDAGQLDWAADGTTGITGTTGVDGFDEEV